MRSRPSLEPSGSYPGELAGRVLDAASMDGSELWERLVLSGRSRATGDDGAIRGVRAALSGRAAATGASGRMPRIGLACSRFNGAISERLLAGALVTLAAAGTPRDSIVIVWVPGAFELPFAANMLASVEHCDVVVCLGAVIRGETAHFDLVAGQCASGIQQVQLSTGIPVIFGVLTTDTPEQAFARSGVEDDAGVAGNTGNKGAEAASAALEMAWVRAEICDGALQGGN